MIVVIVVLLLGAVVACLSDILLGKSWESIPLWKRVVHKLAYMVWGGMLALVCISL